MAQALKDVPKRSGLGRTPNRKGSVNWAQRLVTKWNQIATQSKPQETLSFEYKLLRNTFWFAVLKFNRMSYVNCSFCDL